MLRTKQGNITQNVHACIYFFIFDTGENGFRNIAQSAIAFVLKKKTTKKKKKKKSTKQKPRIIE